MDANGSTNQSISLFIILLLFMAKAKRVGVGRCYSSFLQVVDEEEEGWHG
jgi:hypothetical protein